MTGVSSSCGACKFLRRKCTSECIFAPYFSYDQAASHFAAVHKVFGASNASRLLLHLPEHCRSEAAITMSYEALARMQDPVYGCVAHIFSLQQQVVDLQEEIELLGSHMACISGKVAGSGDPLVTSSIDEGLQFYSQACLPDIQECMKPQMGPPAATCMTVHHIPVKVAGSGDTPVTNNIDEGLQFSSRACLPDIEDYMTPQIEQPEATGFAVHIQGKIAGSSDPHATNGMNDGLQFFPQACLPTIQEYMESQGLRGNTVHQISSYYPNIPPQPTNEGQNLHTTFYPSPSETLLGQVSQETSEYCPWIFNGMQL